jgi:putative flippase GtrA
MKSQNPVLTTAIACAGMALVAISIGLVVGQPRPAVALAAGLLIGAANGFLVRRALGFEAGFRATSIARLMVLTIAGLAAGLFLGLDVVSWAIVGLAGAQLMLAAAAARELVRR